MGKTLTTEARRAEGARHPEEARATTTTSLGLRAAVDAVLADGRIEDRLLNEGWVPTAPAEVAAVLEDHAASLESAHEEIEALKCEVEARLARLEARLSAGPNWSPEPGNVAEEGLLGPHRLGDGSIDFSAGEASGDAIRDMSTTPALGLGKRNRRTTGAIGTAGVRRRSAAACARFRRSSSGHRRHTLRPKICRGGNWGPAGSQNELGQGEGPPHSPWS